MIAMVLLNKKSWRLSEKDKEYILKNYQTKEYKEISKDIGFSTVTIYSFVKSQGLKKRKTRKDVKVGEVEEIIKVYNGKINNKELLQIVNTKLNTDYTYDVLYELAKDLGFKAFSGNRGKIRRLFVDGDRNNLDINNIMLIDGKLYRSIVRMDRTPETAKAIIDLARFNKELKNYEVTYVARNLKKSQVVKSNTRTGIALKIGYERGAYAKRKTIGENGGKIIGDWEVTREVTTQSRYKLERIKKGMKDE